jgi:hypothetical protein
MIDTIVRGKRVNDIAHPYRAGTIIYTNVGDKLYFLMGIDKRSGEYCDFGGGVKSGETMIECAYREFYEESCGMFKNVISINDYENAVCIINKQQNMGIFFLYIDSKWLTIAEEKFLSNQSKLRVQKYYELQGVKWLHDYNFKRMIYDKKTSRIWSRIKRIIQSTSWIELKMTLTIGDNLQCIKTLYEEWNTVEISA